MHQALLLYSVALVVAVLLSELARQSILSTAVLFLVCGFVFGSGVLGWVNVKDATGVVEELATVALFTVLYADAQRLDVRRLLKHWRLPGRALVLGLPLTLLIAAATGHWLVGLGWLPALLVAAILSPTDPVFASAIVGREEVPRRVRFLLNVESGINDGLALPLVLLLLELNGGGQTSALTLGGEILGGIAIGVAIPALVLWLEGRRLLAVLEGREPMLVIAIGLLVFTSCSALHLNEFLGAFAAGVTLATRSERMQKAFLDVGERIAELVKLLAVFLFGVLLTPSAVLDLSFAEWLYVAAVFLVARPAGLLLALWGSPLRRAERLTVAWFGPRGFASVVFGLYLLHSGAPGRDHLFHLVAMVVAVSMLVHSSTDVLAARRFRRKAEEEEGQRTA